MKNRAGAFAIDEQALPTVGWDSEAGTDYACALEEDVRGLLRRIGELEYHSQDQENRAAKDKEKLLLELLEIGDAFERVFRNLQEKPDQVTPQMKKWMGNFRTIQRMFNDILSYQGVTRIEILEPIFDPVWQKAVETIEDSSKPEGTIVEEIRAGYMIHKKVLRKAEVKVARVAGAGDDADEVN